MVVNNMKKVDLQMIMDAMNDFETTAVYSTNQKNKKQGPFAWTTYSVDYEVLWNHLRDECKRLGKKK